jgi:release factor glutamine methyltransferase
MGVKIQTIKDIRIFLAGELEGVYPESEIRALSDILIKNATGITKLHQLYDNRFEVSDMAAEKIMGYAEELKTGKPIQYIFGETVFYNCRIKVNSTTLIPRPETEELVDLIIRENKGYNGSIIDFGSGSGCITIALAANLPESIVTGVEISDDAILIARENGALNNVNVSFIKADIFNFNNKTAVRAGIIVSNPPYVRNSEKLQMNKNVLDFEPPLALFVTDSDPLVYYDAIIKLAEKILLPDGRLYFEINEMMGSSLSTLLKSSDYSDIEIVKDLNEKERIIKCRKNG